MLTVLTDHWTMPHYLIWPLYRLKRVTGMFRLPSGLLLASLASVRPFASQPITRWGFATMVTVLRPLSLDLPQLSEHFLQHLSQGGFFRPLPCQLSFEPRCLRSLCRQFLLQLYQFLFCRHACSLAALATLPVPLCLFFSKIRYLPLHRLAYFLRYLMSSSVSINSNAFSFT